MRKSVIFMVFLFCFSFVKAQSTTIDIEEGDVLALGEPSGSSYGNIDFPRKNIIIKRGAIANFNALVGKKLIVSEVSNTKDGTVIATLKRKDGLNFFRFFPKVTAHLNKAIESGELKKISIKKFRTP